MVAIKDNARVTKRGTRELVKPPNDPREDWTAASHAVWQWMLANGQKHGAEDTVDGVHGWIWEGSLSAAVTALWPDLSGPDFDSVAQYMATVVKRNGLARNISPARGPQHTPWWFVADTPGLLPAGAPKSKAKPVTDVDAAAAERLAHYEKARSKVLFALGYLGVTPEETGEGGKVSTGALREWLKAHGAEMPASTIRSGYLAVRGRDVRPEWLEGQRIAEREVEQPTEVAEPVEPEPAVVEEHEPESVVFWSEPETKLPPPEPESAAASMVAVSSEIVNLRRRVAELEDENARLRRRIAFMRSANHALIDQLAEA